jgi:hypothetical protein
MKRTLIAAAAATGALAAVLAVPVSSALSASGTPLSGTLALTAGKAKIVGGRPVVTGTYFRMLEPGQTDEYFPNPNSTVGHTEADESYTLLAPGKQGGLELGKFQPPPANAFNASNGNALANSVTLPQKFASINFSISTAPKDAQSGDTDPAPTLVLRGTKLTGNLSAWTAEWNKIYFNQGAPKPNGSYPGLTRPVTGTYDSKTHAFTITWYSAIVGGPFNGFTGFWHLEGHLKP